MKKKSLTIRVFLSISLIGAITLITTGYLWIDTIRDRYQIESQQLRDYHTDKVKNELKSRVDSLVKFIEYRIETTEKLLKEDIRDRVYEVRSLINHLYLSNKDSVPEEELKGMIRESLRGLRFNNGRGYYFIDTLEGDVVLYPVNSGSEGMNLYNLQDERGNYALQDEINLVKKQSEGYIEGYWKKPGKADRDYKKIAYVHGFEPYNWYFGTGEYVDEVQIQVQQEVKDYINQLFYGEKNDQYVFIHDYQGTELANGAFPELIGTNNIGLKDLQGVEIIKKQISIVQSEPHYGYLSHFWPMPDGSGDQQKLTYISNIPAWGWVIGSGADMNALEQAISKHDQELQKKLAQSINNIVLLMIGIFIGSLIIANLLASSISKSIRFFTRHMGKSSENLMIIDKGQVEYQDFVELADVSNKMTRRINALLHKDELTQLYNRRYINKVLETLVIHARCSGHNLSLILFDIDHFKQFNDTYGHQVGDKVLIQVAEHIKQRVREKDFVGRYGGEEILVLLPTTSHAEAVDIGNRIRQSLSEMFIPEVASKITVSGGVASSSSQSAEEMIRKADVCLYQAKEQGRNLVVGETEILS